MPRLTLNCTWKRIRQWITLNVCIVNPLSLSFLGYRIKYEWFFVFCCAYLVSYSFHQYCPLCLWQNVFLQSHCTLQLVNPLVYVMFIILRISDFKRKIVSQLCALFFKFSSLRLPELILAMSMIHCMCAMRATATFFSVA